MHKTSWYVLIFIFFSYVVYLLIKIVPEHITVRLDPFSKMMMEKNKHNNIYIQIMLQT